LLTRNPVKKKKKMLTKELLKKEIDRIDDGYIAVLYKIVKALQVQPKEADENLSDWKEFVGETYGCLADDPIERGGQGSYEIREALE